MKKTVAILLASVAVVLITCCLAFAHHGSSVTYNMKKAITLKGTVAEFVYTNPHCQLYFDVRDDAGNTVRWGGETMAPRLVVKAGLSKGVVKAGDQITITVFPAKAGTNFGLIQTLTLPSGQTISLISADDAASRGENGSQSEYGK
jgi:uncharacterized protein DUF6152